MEMLKEVGLGYIKVGQSATTLSGGEAQRVKLSKELSRRATGKTLYILDEPTTGLHFEDVRKLLEVLHRLAGQGNTVVVIEHNLDVIKTADWVIDLGPGGGVNGGKIIAEGPPEVIADVAISATGQYLRPILERASVKPKIVETKPKRVSRSRRAAASDNEDELGLVAAK
jgi:excinuclease ABC subunit A